MKNISTYIKEFSNSKNIINRDETVKLKGGKTNKKYIWNGCGGMIPQ